MKIAVAGCGMIGAAAAKYLAMDGHDVTLFGPPEPAIVSEHTGVFSSHYDEGRITRKLDPDPIWSALATASIARYHDIERDSGIDFYHPVGVLMAARQETPFIEQVAEVAAQSGTSFEDLNGAGLRDAFSYLRFSPEHRGLYQTIDAGHISPRRLVAAQEKLACIHGATRDVNVVDRVEPGRVVRGDGTQAFDHVLVAAGAFSNTILPDHLNLRVLGRTITFLEVSEATAKKLAKMPAVIFRVDDGAEPYLLPPILYPDGKYYIKIGGEPDATVLSSLHDLKSWFRSDGDAKIARYQEERVRSLMPDIEFLSCHAGSCAVTYTNTKLPFMTALDDRLSVATGGCGGAAKSSDEIGRIAARTVLGAPDPRFGMKIEEERL